MNSLFAESMRARRQASSPSPPTIRREREGTIATGRPDTRLANPASASRDQQAGRFVRVVLGDVPEGESAPAAVGADVVAAESSGRDLVRRPEHRLGWDTPL